MRLGPDAAILFPGVVTIRPAPPKITLDRVRPTVVRRRVYENPSAQTPAADDDDEDSGPPSSVNVARALASLRGHELRRLDEILTRDDDFVALAAPVTPATPVTPAIPTIGVGTSITLVELARRLGIVQEELVTALVTRGFFDVTVKATLPRETARAAAAMFGWSVEDTNESAAVSAKSKAKAKAKAKPAKAKPAKAKPAKAKAAPPPKARPQARPKARPTTPGGRRTSRRA